MYDVSNPFLRKISETQSKYKLTKKEITQQSSYNLSLELEDDLLKRKAIIELEDKKSFYTLNEDVKLYLCPSVISLIGQEYNNDSNSLIFVHTKSSGGTEKFQIRRADNNSDNYAWFKIFYDSNIENSYIKIYYDESKKILYFDVDYNIEVLNDDSSTDKDFDTDTKHENDAINSFRNFYLRNLTELIKSEEGCIKLRNEFNEEYPLNSIKALTIEDYSLGTELSKSSFCYKIEYGKYWHAGPSIKGANSQKHGIYMHEGNYTINGEAIPKDKVNETWNNFINQFTSFIEESGITDEPIRASDKYSLLENRMSAVLTKLLYLYYPEKYINICKSESLKLLLKWFGYSYDENMHAEELNFILNKNIRNDIHEVNENDPQYLGSALWNFLKEYSKDEEDDAIYDEGEDIQLKEISDSTTRLTGGDNVIYYGVPGTGKSFSIDEKIEKINTGKKFDLNDVLRVTFHPEYTYNDFIGQLLPTVIKEGENKGKYKYDFKEGPFTTALKRAYMNPDKNVYLILEEMSRGNCAAIFGDVFQLLDRDNEGKSRYFVDNEVVANEILTDSKYKNIILNIEELYSNKIRIPSNLYIWGTVNTSDQNVFVMDTAFKRRFEWKYVDTKPIEEKDKDGHTVKNERGEIVYLNDIDLPIVYDTEVEKISWIRFYQILNKYISSSNYLGLGEDKQLGQFFINFYKTDEDFIKDKFNNKLLHYLWFDVQEKSYKEDKKLFNDDITCFSDLYSFSQKNKKIFSDEFIKFIKERL